MIQSFGCNRQITFPPLAEEEHRIFRQDVRVAMLRDPWNVNTSLATIINLTIFLCHVQRGPKNRTPNL